MKLYHGSNTDIKVVDFGKCRPYKDFGRGFYLTDILHQAERMAAKTTRIYQGSPTVSVFEFDLEEAKRAGLKIKEFKEPDREWALFVMRNRDIL